MFSSASGPWRYPLTGLRLRWFLLLPMMYGAWPAFGEVAPTNEELAEFAVLPEPANPRHVQTAADLQAALADAAPGDRIVLRAAEYGEVTIARSFSAGKPLVLQSEPLHGAVFRQIAVTGSDVIISGVMVTGGGATVRGSRVRVTRCLLRDTRIAVAVLAGRDIVIDHCEIAGHSYRAFYLAPPAQDIIAARNYIHDGSKDALSVFALGGGHNHRNHALRAIVRHNYVERVMRDFIHIKSSENLVAYNTFVHAHPSNEVSIRHGRENRIIGNNAAQSTIGVRDYNPVIFGNRAAKIRVFGGDIRFTYDELKGKIDGVKYSTQPASRNARLAGNIAAVIVGFNWPEDCGQGDPQPAENTWIYQNSEAPTPVPDSCIRWSKGTVDAWKAPAPKEWGAIPSPVTLAKRDVGPHAR